MKLHKVILYTILAIFLIVVNNTKAQSSAGVLGRKNIAGLKFDLILKPISLYKHLYYERMFGNRINLGASFQFGNSIHNFFVDEEENRLSSYSKITTTLNETTRYVYSLTGEIEQKKTGFEVYLKCFRKVNPGRNYGLYWSYKYGQIRAVNSLKAGSIIYLNNPSGGNSSIPYRAINESRNVIYKSYLGFELGNSFPLFKDGLMLNLSLSFNLMLQAKQSLPREGTLSQYLEVYNSNYINKSHPISLNFGINYAF